MDEAQVQYTGWCGVHAPGAMMEGWSIFTASATASDWRWQVVMLDGAELPPGQLPLADDESAFALVLQGHSLAAHAAREFIRAHSPGEWHCICLAAPRLVDVATLPEWVQADIVAAALK